MEENENVVAETAAPEVAEAPAEVKEVKEPRREEARERGDRPKRGFKNRTSKRCAHSARIRAPSTTRM